MVSTALSVAKMLAEKGIDVGVVDMYSIKPLDKEAVRESKESRLLVTLEEHSKLGGLGGAVAEVVSEEGGFPRLLRLGIADVFDLAGDYDGLLKQNRLTAPLITEDIVKAL